MKNLKVGLYRPPYYLTHKRVLSMGYRKIIKCVRLKGEMPHNHWYVST